MIETESALRRSIFNDGSPFPGAELARLRALGGDCLSENFARIGYPHKTTYAFDDYFFDVRYRLGRLAVRMKREDIAAALED